MNTVDPLVRVSLAYIVNTHNLFNNYQESCIECALTECSPVSTVCLCADFTSRVMMHLFSGKVTLPFVCSLKMLASFRPNQAWRRLAVGLVRGNATPWLSCVTQKLWVERVTSFPFTPVFFHSNRRIVESVNSCRKLATNTNSALESQQEGINAFIDY